MDATDVENGFGPILVGMSEINENLDAVADDNATVATAESSDTETKKSPLVGMARKSFTRMKTKPNLRASLQRRLSKENLTSRRQSFAERVDPSSDETGKDDLLENKKKTEVRAADNWWKFVFVFSFISMTACVLTLWLEYPYGARMSTEEVATMPWSNGCVGLDSCICPRTTILKCWINFADSHEVHSMFGTIVGLEVTSHSFFHLLRWAKRNDDIQLLWTTRTGVTGLVALIATPLIVLPMSLPILKARLSFELRKSIHYLAILWAAALMAHAPERIFWMIGVPLLVYIADVIIGYHKTHLIDNTYFERVGKDTVLVTFKTPDGMAKSCSSSFVYVMIPWISKYQWHAFSVYGSKQPGHSQLCITKASNASWTAALIDEMSVPSHRPMFVTQAYLSPFNSHAMDSTNLIAMASGIERTLDLIWMCRQAELIEFMLSSLDVGGEDSDCVALIYYTGKRPLLIDYELPSNVRIYQGRPDLPRLVDAITSKTSPDRNERFGGGNYKLDDANYGLKRIKQITESERPRVLIARAMETYTNEQLFKFAVDASNSQNQNRLGMDSLTDSVDYMGVRALLKHLAKGDFHHISAQVTENFELHSPDGMMSQSEFSSFLASLLPCDGNGLPSDGKGGMAVPKTIAANDLTSEDFENKDQAFFDIENQDVINSVWGMFYCGGSNIVANKIKQIGRETGIPVVFEKFDW
ncbi:hypothetical protein THAOC_33548 [Thalassiosira oceanica]|uniref:FAD-binding 8 domain-containing protein n=1 Tax=Thalassiosira oceanica TaxID=159749 RepID=K0R6Y1_THAOC|nr:hypothetical protein THAOC_33548 [Thalassiosira oceanica]|eukprot:EJK47714.1 hypothetical protein THAOC_33548 [Thalassiosira oceanica]